MARSIVSQSKYMLLGKLSTPVFAFVLLVILGLQSDTMLGQYALIMTYYFVLQVIPLFGLTPFIMREVAKTPEHAGRYFYTIGALSIVGCLLLYLGMRLVLSWLEYSDSVEQSIEVVLYAIFPGILAFIAEILLVSLGRAKEAALIVLLENALRLVLSIAVLFTSGRIEDLFWVLLATKVLSLCLFYWVFLKQQLFNAAGFDRPLMDNVFEVMPVFFANTLLFLVVGRLDFFILSLYHPVELVGYYAIAYRVLEICMVAVSAVLMVLYPKFSKVLQKQPRLFVSTSTTIAVYFLTLVTVLAFAGIVFANEYVLWFFPQQYPQPLLLAMLFSALLLVSASDYFCSGALNVSNQQVVDLKAMAIGSVLFAGCLLLLVPGMGMNGAFIACLLAPVVQLICKLLFARSPLVKVRISYVLRYCIAVGLLFWVAFAISGWPFLLKLISAPIILAIFLFGLHLLGVIRLVRQLTFLSHIMALIGDETSDQKGSPVMQQLTGFSRWVRQYGKFSPGFDLLCQCVLMTSLWVNNNRESWFGIKGVVHRYCARLLLPRLMHLDHGMVDYSGTDDVDELRSGFLLSAADGRLSISTVPFLNNSIR